MTNEPKAALRLSLFDPWTATEETALAVQAAQMASGSPPAPQCQALMQWRAARSILGEKAKIESGDGAVTLQSMFVCCWQALAIPRWLQDAFVARCEPVYTAHQRSWDEAFGAPHPRSARLGILRQDDAARFDLFERVRRELTRPDRPPLDRHFWERMGRPKLNARRAEAVFRETAAILGVNLDHLKASVPKPIKPRRPRK